MKDNKGITLIELVVAIAISSVVLMVIYSFYITGVKGYTRETTTVSNQVSIRRVSNQIAQEIRRASNVEIPDSSTLILKDEIGNMIAKIKYNNPNYTIEAAYYTDDGAGSMILSHNRMLAERIGFFEARKDNDKTIITIESIENSEGYTDKLETVITQRK